jgi:hypothetical protein
MKRENQFYNWIKTNSNNIYLCKIEHSLSVGIPDLLAVINNKTVFLELKINTTNSPEKIGLNKFQKAWHIKFNKSGGLAFILVNRVIQSDLKLFKLGAGGISHIITQPKTRHGLQNIFDAIKNYKN